MEPKIILLNCNHSDIIQHLDRPILEYVPGNGVNTKDSESFQCKHIYIVDDNISGLVGDWSCNNKYLIKHLTNPGHYAFKVGYRKVIATTDPDLVGVAQLTPTALNLLVENNCILDNFKIKFYPIDLESCMSKRNCPENSKFPKVAEIFVTKSDKDAPKKCIHKINEANTSTQDLQTPTNEVHIIIETIGDLETVVDVAFLNFEEAKNRAESLDKESKDSGYTDFKHSVKSLDLNPQTSKKAKLYTQEEMRQNLVYCVSSLVAKAGLIKTAASMKVWNDKTNEWHKENKKKQK